MLLRFVTAGPMRVGHCHLTWSVQRLLISIGSGAIQLAPYSDDTCIHATVC